MSDVEDFHNEKLKMTTQKQTFMESYGKNDVNHRSCHYAPRTRLLPYHCTATETGARCLI